MIRPAFRRLALVAAAALAAAGSAACSSDSYTVTAVFDDVGDLVTRHSVQVADVRVGRVKSITLTDDYKAKVVLSLDPSYRIPRNSEAVLRTTSLLGEKFVELRPLGKAGEGPYLRDGDRVAKSSEAPELEFVADQAVAVLGAVVADDVASMVETGAAGFGGRGPELRSLITDLATISSTLAARTGEITTIIDNLDRAMGTLAGGDQEIDGLLGNLATTTKVLADNRQRAVNALEQLTRLAAVQNDTFQKYRADIQRQIAQLDSVVAVAAQSSAEVGNLIDWLARFTKGVQTTIPITGPHADFTQVFMWLIPADQDPRVEP